MPLLAPVLSQFDPDVEAEGSLDPLGLATTYDFLAERIYPLFTVRMNRPRFITAIAAGARICQDAEDVLPADGVTTPYLALEWIVVDAFARSREDTASEDRGIPGINKALRARRSGRPLGAAAYLNTPKVFGFTGVYKRAAVGMYIVDDDISLDEGGCELVRVWEREQRLPGFYDGQTGAGADLRCALTEAVRATLKKGSVAPPDSWKWWPEVVRIFSPGTAGPQEKAWLLERLKRGDLNAVHRDPEALSVRRELLEFLMTRGAPVSRMDEAQHLAAAKKHGSHELVRRVEAIEAFEAVARPLTDAFDLLRFRAMDASDGMLQVDDYRRDERAIALASRVQHAVHDLEAGFNGDPLPPSAALLGQRFAKCAAPRVLLELLIEHHEEIQRQKPPDGKRPWLERVKGDALLVRAPYRLSKLPDPPMPFVHDYRSGTASRFLTDLAGLGA